MDGCPRQNPAYRSTTERPRSRGAFLLLADPTSAGSGACAIPSIDRVFVDEIPKTSVGKFRKTALREQFAAAEPAQTT